MASPSSSKVESILFQIVSLCYVIVSLRASPSDKIPRSMYFDVPSNDGGSSREILLNNDIHPVHHPGVVYNDIFEKRWGTSQMHLQQARPGLKVATSTRHSGLPQIAHDGLISNSNSAYAEQIPLVYWQ